MLGTLIELCLDLCEWVIGKMRYKFKVTEDGKEEIEKEAMSFKKLLKSLVIPNPKWTGFMSYENKKGRYVVHSILNGKRI